MLTGLIHSAQLRPSFFQIKCYFASSCGQWGARGGWRGVCDGTQLRSAHFALAPDSALGLLRHAQTSDAINDIRDSSQEDRKSVGSGKSVSVRVDLGGRRLIKK